MAQTQHNKCPDHEREDCNLRKAEVHGRMLLGYETNDNCRRNAIVEKDPPARHIPVVQSTNSHCRNDVAIAALGKP